MKAAVLGAAGIIGRDISRRLASNGSWDLMVADRKEKEVRALAKDFNCEAATVDVRDPAATATTLHGRDLVVNATWYYFNLDVMEASLRAGCDYIDLGGLYHTTRKQLTLAPRFERDGRLAVLGCGKAPGITNVLAAHAARHFDQISSVRLRSGRRPLEEVPELRLPYSPQTLIDEMTLPPVVLKDGHMEEIAALSRKDQIRHPEPFGQIEYLTTLHSELATLPRFLGRGIKDMDFQVALSTGTVRALEALIRLGLTSADPVVVEGQKVIPRDFAVAMLSGLPPAKGREIWITEAELHGSKDSDGRAVTARVTGDETQNGTSIGAVVAATLLGQRRVQVTGVHAPETVFPATEFISELTRTGLRATETVTEERMVNAS